MKLYSDEFKRSIFTYFCKHNRNLMAENYPKPRSPKIKKLSKSKISTNFPSFLNESENRYPNGYF